MKPYPSSDVPTFACDTAAPMSKKRKRYLSDEMEFQTYQQPTNVISSLQTHISTEITYSAWC